MTKNSRYEINHFQAKVILTKQFAKAASTLNTPEYMTLLELRRNHPDYTFELREIRKKEGKKSYLRPPPTQKWAGFVQPVSPDET